MGVLASLENWEVTVAVSGTVDLPTNWNFTDTTPNENQEYDVIVVAGDGSLDIGTKTFESFDVTVAVGGATFQVCPKKPGVMVQVS